MVDPGAIPAHSWVADFMFFSERKSASGLFSTGLIKIGSV